VSIDRCGSCSGEFYDPTELDRVHFFDEPSRRELTRLVEPRLRQPGKDERIGCPGCGHSMEIVDVAAMKPFQIDVCPKCKGTWLDGGEAEHLRSLVGAKVGGGGPVPIVPTAASPYDGEGRYVPDAEGAMLAADAVDLAVDAAFFLTDILSD
jgi:Zn-finger nucleic acid-binding protein